MRNNLARYDVVIVAPPSRSISHYRPPVSLLYLGGYLTHNGLSVKIIDPKEATVVRDSRFFADYELMKIMLFNQTAKEIKNSPAEFYAVSCYSPEYKECCELIQVIRAYRPEAKIIVGGVHPTLCPEAFEGIADCIICGEGEVALYDAVTKKLSGIIEADIHPIDDISFPDYSLIDMEYYVTPNPYAIRGVYASCAYVLATRGCPSSCTFCVAPRLRKYTGAGRYRSVKLIADEIAMLKERYKIDAVYFIDDMLAVNNSFIIRLCHELEKLDIVWGCSAKVNSVNNKEILWWMKSAGCIQIDFGIEQASDQRLYDLKKYQSVSQIKNVVSLCKTYGIRVFANMLVGLPKETANDYEEIVNLLEEIRADVVSVNVFCPYLGTELKEKNTMMYPRYFAENTTRRFNSVWLALRFHTSWNYLSMLWRSRCKQRYARNLWQLLKEAQNQS